MPPKPVNAYDFLELPTTSIQLDVNAADAFLRTHGVKLSHYRAMRCPIGLTDRHDQTQSHEDHSECQNGYLYTQAGDMTCFFLGNSQQPEWKDIGKLTVGQVQSTFPRFYDTPAGGGNGDDPVSLCVYDRFYLGENVVVYYWQTVQYNPSGIDRLHFPAVKVTDLVDNLGASYKQGIDFNLEKGRIVWLARSPGMDPESRRGRIYSVRYSYRPYFYLSRFIHEVRVSRIMDTDGNVSVVSMPQSGVLTREYMFENKKRKASGPNQDPRLEIGEDIDANEI